MEKKRIDCPHCSVNFPLQVGTKPVTSKHEGHWWVQHTHCPACEKAIIWLLYSRSIVYGPTYHTPSGTLVTTLVYPRGTNRQPVPTEVPDEYAEDYREACLILRDSPKASAALSRRCLQHVLREKAGIKSNNLFEEIQKVRGSLPSNIASLLDVPRDIGNIAAHPMKNADTGLIVSVEPWEAEWCLEIIEALFDYYFVMPAKNAARKRRLNEKMEQARKKNE